MRAEGGDRRPQHEQRRVDLRDRRAEERKRAGGDTGRRPHRCRNGSARAHDQQVLWRCGSQRRARTDLTGRALVRRPASEAKLGSLQY